VLYTFITDLVAVQVYAFDCQQSFELLNDFIHLAVADAFTI
jgi:hypothetical protein